MIPKKI
jgi:electron-transferring-flavoprotein dehydrogenase